MYFDKATRGEKISGIKLTAVSYGILLMMLALAAGLWRLQVLGASNFACWRSRTAFARSRSWPRGASCSTARTG